ncbi:MAG: hypothetical protein K6G39_02890 [Bacteroidales bacterium]|nr:hypothetical protein [Bacteroidales bacterium]
MGLLDNILTSAIENSISGRSKTTSTKSSSSGSALKKAATTAAAAAAVGYISKKIKSAMTKKASTATTASAGSESDIVSAILRQIGGSSSGVSTGTIKDILGSVLGSNYAQVASGMDIGELAQGVLSVIGMANAAK